MESTPYPYEPVAVEKKEVRFMNLVVTDRDDEPLRCNIVHAVLDGTREYDALSYVWGPEEFPETLYIGERHYCKITVSLRRALCDIRAVRRRYSAARDQSHHPYWIWADAVCINQADTDEREKQISLMGDLYHHAAEVFIHTGPPLRDGLVLSHFLRVIGLIAVRHGYPDARPELGRLESLSSVDQLLAKDERYWSALKELTCRAWVTRAWILQEVLLSPRNLTLLYGTERVTLEEVTMAIRFVDDYQNYLPQELQADHVDADVYACIRRVLSFGLLKYAMMEGTIPAAPTLEQLLAFFWNCQCRYPLDMIYCLSNLASDWKPLDLKIKYDVDDAELFTKAACRMINTSQSTDILHQVTLLGSPALPSWVPDWTHTSESWQLINNWSLLTSSLNPYDYSAGGTCPPQLLADETAGVLRLDGCIVDHVSFVSAVLDPKAMTDLAAWSAWMEKHSQYLCLNEDNSTVAGVSVELAMTLIAGKCLPWKKAGEEETMSAFAKWQKGLQDAALLLLPPPFQSEEINYTAQIQRYWPGRRWGKTSVGRMALLPSKTCTGDTVCIVPGMKTPFVLRKERVSGRYGFVGECYVHGIMDGELLESGNLVFEKIMIV